MEPLLQELDFSVRAHNALRAAGVETLDALCAMTPKELARLENVGRLTVTNINEVLAEHGLSLRPEPSPRAWARPPTPLTPRQEAVWAARENGQTFPQIARQYGVCVERARQIYLRAKQKRAALSRYQESYECAQL